MIKITTDSVRGDRRTHRGHPDPDIQVGLQTGERVPRSEEDRHTGVTEEDRRTGGTGEQKEAEKISHPQAAKVESSDATMIRNT
jgi:hypothetical protein